MGISRRIKTGSCGAVETRMAVCADRHRECRYSPEWFCYRRVRGAVESLAGGALKVVSKFSNTTPYVCADRPCPGLDDFAILLPVFEFCRCDDAIYTSAEAPIDDALPNLKILPVAGSELNRISASAAYGRREHLALVPSAGSSRRVRDRQRPVPSLIGYPLPVPQ